ncbi:MAG: cysteine synthase A [Peptostreptococcaceae bacterium]|nr:cysteine synthase A [Peptostreptococcaceae bacterium]
MKYYESIANTIGNTPLIKLNKIMNEKEIEANILAKVEMFNPGGSIKDRVALAMIEKAEKEGKLSKGGVIIESTSGNTGIGLAAVGAAKGYKVILTMPESMSIERRQILTAYGAEVVLTPAKEGMLGAGTEAIKLNKEIKGSIIAGQFTNMVCVDIHYKTTGPEIYKDLDGKVDILVAGIGTGGTISGAGKFLKEKNPDIKIVAVEPLHSPLLSKGEIGPHGIQGIGANFIPEILDTEIYDEIIAVDEEDAYEYGKLMATKEGLLVGISSGAALFAACELGKLKENKKKNIVVILPDTGTRYLSTKMFEN